MSKLRHQLTARERRERSKLIAKVTCECRLYDWFHTVKKQEKGWGGSVHEVVVGHTALYPVKAPGNMFTLVYHHPRCNKLLGAWNL